MAEEINHEDSLRALDAAVKLLTLNVVQRLNFNFKRYSDEEALTHHVQELHSVCEKARRLVLIVHHQCSLAHEVDETALFLTCLEFQQRLYEIHHTLLNVLNESQVELLARFDELRTQWNCFQSSVMTELPSQELLLHSWAILQQITDITPDNSSDIR